jgi:hypothetical protein
MTSETHVEGRTRAPAGLRFLAFVLGFGAVIFWLLVARENIIGSVAPDVRLGLQTTLVLLLLIWPGTILAICNVMIRPALALIGAGAAIYAAIAFVHMPKPTGPVPLLVAALIAILMGTWWLFGRGGEVTEGKFEDARRRLAVLYAAGLGTVLWLTSFVPIMTTVRGSGFEAIPAFYGTIFFLAVVLPLMIIGLTGAQHRRATATQALLVLTLVVTAIFGAPQIFQ